MFYKLRDLFNRRLFDAATNAVRRTAKIPRDMGGPIFLSLLRSKDLNLYLLAVKSLARFLPPSRVIVIDDGLTPHDRQILQTAIGDVECPVSSKFSEADCPTGGCWERLLAIAHYSREGFVIQVDADTLTVTDPIEVREAVAKERCFTLGTESGREFVSLTKAAEISRNSESRHIQVLAEQILDILPEHLGDRYVLGCAGSSGFSQGSLERERIIEFSNFMESHLGEIWRAWGSEQLTSNFMIANAQDAYVLPVDYYVNYQPETVRVHDSIRFYHFIGSYRYSSGHLYTRLARRIINRLETEIKA